VRAHVVRSGMLRGGCRQVTPGGGDGAGRQIQRRRCNGRATEELIQAGQVDAEAITLGVQASEGLRNGRHGKTYESEDGGLAFYRKHTEGMLRKYLRMSMEVGRVPACMPREMFRGSVTAYRVRSFEDCVIFVHDMEQCLAAIEVRYCALITKITLQEYTQSEASSILGVSSRQLARQYGEALDQLTGLLLARGLLNTISY
jgi:hypothetical protein